LQGNRRCRGPGNHRVRVFDRARREAVQAGEPEREERDEGDQRGGQRELTEDRATPHGPARCTGAAHHAGVHGQRRIDAVLEGWRQPAEAFLEFDFGSAHAGTSLATESGPSRPRSFSSARWTRTLTAISLTSSTSPTSPNVKPSK